MYSIRTTDQDLSILISEGSGDSFHHRYIKILEEDFRVDEIDVSAGIRNNYIGSEHGKEAYNYASAMLLKLAGSADEDSFLFHAVIEADYRLEKHYSEDESICCPRCGRKLHHDSSSSLWRAYECKDCDLRIDFWPDPETPVSITSGKLRVDWYNAGEGLCGGYDPEDPDDMNLLRFDVYKSIDDGNWEAVDDASYCTQVSAETPDNELLRLLYSIFNEYYDAIIVSEAESVKKLGESLSWISSCRA